MSIRTRSVSTGRPAGLRNIGRFLTIFLVLGVLVGCGSGTADEAKTLSEREASKTAQVPIVQATTEAFFVDGTPQGEPSPTQTPVAILADLVLTTGVNGDGSPQASVSSVGGGTIIAAAKVHTVTKGTVFAAVWGKTDGTQIDRTETTAKKSAGDQWFDFSWDGAASLSSGEYAVFIYADSMLIGSLSFQKY